MNLKEACNSKGGQWIPYIKGCRINNELFLDEDRKKCLKDGDEFENFKGTGVMACREVDIDEYCSHRVNEIIEYERNFDEDTTMMQACFSYQIPQKKIFQGLKYIKNRKQDSEYVFDLSRILFRNNVLNEDNVTMALDNDLDIESLIENQNFTKHNLEIALNRLSDKNLEKLYKTVEIKDEDILIMAIDIDLALDSLYHHQKISGRVMTKAIEKGRYLNKLVKLKMDNKHISQMIDKIVDEAKEPLLESLYMNNTLNYKNISKAMQLGKFLRYVYKNPMKPEQVTRALEIGQDLFSLYSHHKNDFTAKQKYEIISKGKQLGDFYSTHVFLTEKMIDTAIKRGVALDRLFSYYELYPHQIDDAMDVAHGDDLSALYHKQKLDRGQINKALRKEEALAGLYRKQILNEKQVDKAIEIGEALSELYKNTKIPMTYEQKTKAIQTGFGDDLYELYRHRRLNEENIDAAFENPNYIAELYANHKLTEQQIYKALELGIDIPTIYKHQDMSPNQLDKVIDNEDDPENLRIIFSNQNLPQFIVTKIINQNNIYIHDERGEVVDKLGILLTQRQLRQEDLYRIYRELQDFTDGKAKQSILQDMFEHQKMTGNIKDFIIKNASEEVLTELYYRQSLTTSNIQNAIDRGIGIKNLITRKKEYFNETNISKLIENGVALHEAYEHLDLTPKNITEAIARGDELENLISNNTLEPEHIDRLIEEGNHLSLLLNQVNITDAQTERINTIFYEKYGFTGKREGKLLGKIDRTIPPEEMFEVLNKAIENKMKNHPLKSVVGTYNVRDQWSEIKDVVEKNGYEFRNKNVKYVYNEKRKQKLGGFLKKNKRMDLVQLLTTVTNEDKKKALFSDFDPRKYEVVLSDDPEDIAIRSAGMKHVQSAKCEAPGHSHGGGIVRGDGLKHVTGSKNGWRDDIKANNLVAILKDKETGEWHARAAIRWCNREDDGLPDAFVEKVYTQDQRKANIFRKTILDVLNEKGFTGRKGPVKCITEYPFSGYVDSDTGQSGKKDQIVLNVADRPQQIERSVRE